MTDAHEPPGAAFPAVPAADMAILGEADALAIWARAARLQADADAVTPPGHPGGAPPADEAPLAIAAGTGAPAGLYLADEIVAAGRAAGIDERFLRLALAEHEAIGGATAIAAEAIDERDRAVLTGLTSRSVQVSRVIPESPATVLAHLRDAVGEAPWSLAFDSVVGAHPEHGGILRFTVPVIGDAPAPRPITSFIYQASRLGMTHLHVTVTRRGTADVPGCELTVTGDFRPGEQFSIRFYKWLQWLLLGVWTLAGTLVGARTGAVLGAVLGAAAGVAASGGFIQLVRAIGRWEHRRAHRILRAELESLLRRVQHTGDAARAFAPARPRLVRGDGDATAMRRASGLVGATPA